MKPNDNFTLILNYLVEKLDNIPELSETIEIIRNNRGINSDFADTPLDYLRIISFDYISIINTLFHLSEEDVDLVKIVNKKRNQIGLDTNPLGQHGIDVLYTKVSKKERSIYWLDFISCLDLMNPLFVNAVTDLRERMTLASKYSKEGVVLADGDPRSDKVIWGHTKGLVPQAMIHFVICHLIDRITYQIFKKSKHKKVRDMILSKHYLFDPFGDVIFLLTTKKMINPEITSRWILAKDRGGLGWNTLEEQRVFDEEYEKRN